MVSKYPEYYLLRGLVVRASETPEGGLRSSIWRNGPWEHGGNFVEASWEGKRLTPEEVSSMLGPEAVVAG